VNNTPEINGKQPRISVLLVIGIILVILFATALGIMVFRAMGAYLVYADPLVRSDAVVVLSGGDSDRLAEGARLNLDNYAGIYILTETGAPLAGYNQDYMDYLKLEVIDLGVPPTAIQVTEKHAKNTYDEAKAVLKLMKDHHVGSCIVVTDPYHTRRAKIIFSDVFRDSEIVVRVWPVRNHWYRPGSWWLSLAGWEATLSEYLRLAAYRLGIIHL
jgi:uncharacterized SAM-binding protein YcdF (DUF218 family)